MIKIIERQLKFVGMVALNRTAANLAMFRMPNLAQEVFDNPTPYILRGFKYRKAEKDNLTAEVFVDDYVGPSPAKSLAAEVFGGQRKLKRFELALQYKGILPAGQYAVPGKDAQRDSYGNMSGSQIVQILSTLQAFAETGYTANKTARSESRKRNPMQLFVITAKGNLTPGIYQRMANHTIKQLIKFVKQPVYEKRFPFFTEGSRLAEEIFQREYSNCFNQYINK